MRSRSLILAIVLILVAGCAAPAGTPPSQSAAPVPEGQSAGKQRIVAGIQGEPVGLHTKLERRSTPGGDALEVLVNSGLSIRNHEGELVPQLAVAVPSLENGLWVVHPDGRMEVTWTIRDGVTWHDGTPLTSEDLVFAVQVGQDRDLPTFGGIGFRSIERVEPIDAATVRVHWRQPYIDADTLFTNELGLPLPKHILGATYRDDKAQFSHLSYWTTEFIGTGPFQMREFVPGSHTILAANDGYVLGRPQIDEIEVRFILEPTTLAANLLAESIDLTMGRNLSLEEALKVRDQWRAGTAVISPRSIAAIWPQFVDPEPQVVTNLQFRRALLHAIDRQSLIDTLMAGMVPLAHSYMSPTSPALKEIEASLPKYEYDVRRATQMVEGLGYTKGAEGTFHDAAGQPLALELRTTAQLDIQPKSMFAVTDYWQRLGVAVTPVVVPNQRVQDQAYRVTFPAFSLIQQGNTQLDLFRLHSSQIALPENNYVGRNRPRYRSPELDALLDRLQVTIPMAERAAVRGQILHHIADQLPVMGLFYGTQVTFVGNRLKGVRPGSDTPTAWNSHEWTVP